MPLAYKITIDSDMSAISSFITKDLVEVFKTISYQLGILTSVKMLKVEIVTPFILRDNIYIDNPEYPK